MVTNVSCAQAESCSTTNPVADGSIKVTIGGGWNAADAFLYYVSATKGTDVRTATMDLAGNATFTGLTAGVWTIKVYEHAAAWFAKPYIMNPDYATAYAAGFPNTKQNPDVTVCFKTMDITVGAPAPDLTTMWTLRRYSATKPTQVPSRSLCDRWCTGPY